VPSAASAPPTRQRRLADEAGRGGSGEVTLARKCHQVLQPTEQYTDRHRLPPETEQELGLTFPEKTQDMIPHCDVVTVNAPLHPETQGMFNADLLATMKRGASLSNSARGLIEDRDAIVGALESGHLAGYSGDVWYPRPAPLDHPWRTMPHHGMTPHISGSSLSAQARYAAGTREILECYY
jgi:formate dehydrogenase